MKQRILIIATIFGLITISSCAGLFRKYDAYMEDWKEQNEELVYKIYGPPMRSQMLKDGRKLVAYDFQHANSERSSHCVVNFEIRDSLVQSASYSGNHSALSHYLKGPNDKKLVD